MIKAVVFDLGEVLSSPPSLLPVLAGRVGTTPELLKEHYWTGRAEYDAGAPDGDYWGPLLTAVGHEVHDADLIAEIAHLDADIWANLRPAAWQLLRDCRQAGVTVAVLSNSPHAMQLAADGAIWRADVDHLYVSASLGAVKPQPAIYERVTSDLGLAPGEIAFIDDKQANVDGALSVGWQAHRWVDDHDTRAWLTALGVLSA
ncbi:HAD family phosphatase [Tessaracoccus sp. MC1756]|uniref:HAD family hydrolase n=1 Tax=Tessaracoccus sp. MC1756 TaxID=2760311 RepID=UPI001602B613|nr:HAD family phosphatase [Tessaracoccus sp. MC1756]MBB1510311.1 HAD family phosphatase [Tessaracoccus sp. MC1756]